MNFSSRPLPRDYSSTWNMQQSPNYKPNPKTTMLPTGTYPASTYSLPPQQQQYYVSSFPYHTPAVNDRCCSSR